MRLLASSCLSVRLFAWHNSAPNGRLFMKFDIWVLFEKSIEYSQVPLKSDKQMTGTVLEHILHVYLCYVMITIYCTCIYVMLCYDHNISVSSSYNEKCFKRKLYRKLKYTFLGRYFFFFPKSCRLWVKVKEYCTARQSTDDNMAHAHCMQDI